MEQKIVKKGIKEIVKNDDNFPLEKEKEVSFIIQGSAVVRKGKPYVQVCSPSVPYDKIVAYLFSKMNGITIESVVREAVKSDIDVTKIKDNAKKALKQIKGTYERKMSGKVTVKDIQVQAYEEYPNKLFNTKDFQ